MFWVFSFAKRRGEGSVLALVMGVGSCWLVGCGPAHQVRAKPPDFPINGVGGGRGGRGGRGWDGMDGGEEENECTRENQRVK
jgi:hypothetical protein